MRVLLDECVPRPLKDEFPGHDVKTVPEAGWAGLKNGELLRRAAAKFDLLFTIDRNLEYQQNLSAVPIAVLVLRATSNDVAVLRPMMAAVREAMPRIRPGRVTVVNG